MAARDTKKPLKTTTARLTDAELERITRENPSAVVYKEVSDESTPGSTLKSDDAGRIVRAIRMKFEQFRHRHSHMTDDEIRKQIVFENREYRTFSTQKPQIFNKITSRDTNDEGMLLIYGMIRTQAEVERGRISKADANASIQEAMLKRFVVGKAPPGVSDTVQKS